MRYISIDIETTGLDHNRGTQILEIAMIIEDTKNEMPRSECPTFHRFIDHTTISGNAKALAMNAYVLGKIADLQASPTAELVRPSKLLEQMNQFLTENGIDSKNPITTAGANFLGFDKKFIEKHIKLFNDDLEATIFFNKFERRSIDPSQFCVDFGTMDHLPTLSQCKVIAGVPGEQKHTALDDAWDVIEVLRTFY